MGELLTEVKSTDKGLVGITKGEGEIPLSEPEPKTKHTRAGFFCDDKTEKTAIENFNRGFKMNVIDKLDKDTYIQLGELDSMCWKINGISQPYALYTKREA